MKKTVISIPKMDCPSEEKLVRMALQRLPEVKRLEFDLEKRNLTLYHRQNDAELISALTPLNFGARVAEASSEIEADFGEEEIQAPSNESEARTLKWLLAINFSMFIVEVVLGWIAQSTGLMADSLDMLADATVYGISLYAVGKSMEQQRISARLSGYMQLLLCLGAFSEVVRRYFVGSEPSSTLMMSVATVALIANVSCLFLISKHRHGRVHMKASWIFSTNDVIANAGVILAGLFVYFTKSSIPDLVIGVVIATVVLRGALTILKMSKKAA